MTNPSEAAKRKAYELANAQCDYDYVGLHPTNMGPFGIALALHLDEVDRVAREVELGVWETGDPDAREKVRSLMLPDPVDPDEELAREVAEYLEAPCDRALIQSALRRLRELGKLVKETPHD